MTYLPTNLIDENYLYSMNNSTITIYKDCNNNQCTCTDINTNIDYLQSNDYTCNSSSIVSVPYNIFTDNFYYRKDFANILIIFLILAFFIFYIPLYVYSKLFKRRW